MREDIHVHVPYLLCDSQCHPRTLPVRGHHVTRPGTSTLDQNCEPKQTSFLYKYTTLDILL
jgi:hypothetical protein